MKRKEEFLKKNRNTTLTIALILAIATVGLAFKAPWYMAVDKGYSSYEEPEEMLISPAVEIEIVKKVEPIPPKRKIIQPITRVNPVVKPIKVIEPIPTPDPKPIKSVKPIKAVTLPVDPPKPPPIKTVTYAEKMPLYPGGDQALMGYLGNTPYCPSAFDMDIEGTVYIEFMVGHDGNVKNVKVKRGLLDCLDEACVNQIKSMPQWEPGMQGEMPVNVIMVVPFKFSLR